MSNQNLLLISLLIFFVFLPWIGSILARIVTDLSESMVSLYMGYLTLGFTFVALTLFLIILYGQLLNFDYDAEKLRESLKILNTLFAVSQQEIEFFYDFLKPLKTLPSEERKIILIISLTTIWMVIIVPLALMVGSTRNAVQNKKSLAEHQNSLQALKSQLREVEEKVAELSGKLSA